MTPLTTSTKILIAIVILLLTVSGGFFFRAQNRREKMGGRISPAKMAWLLYAVTVWFFLSPIIAFDATVPRSFSVLLGAFSVLMWTRGLVEVLMLYVTKNWQPPLGMAHNLLCTVFLVAGLYYYRDQGVRFGEPLQPWLLGFVATLVVSLLVETVYAFLFHKAVAGKTTGGDGVWFASQEDSRFRHINRLTATINVPLYGFLMLFLAAAYGLW